MALKGKRGAVLMETAIVTNLAVLLMTAVVQLTIVGYDQVSLDGTTFTQAREQALRQSSIGTETSADSSTNAIQVATSTYGAVGSSVLAQAKAYTAPAHPSGVTYGPSAKGARTGGQSVLLPTQIAAATSTATNFLGEMFKDTSVSGFAIEPEIQEVCPHYCLEDNGYSTTSARVNYFQGGDDTPPYYEGFRFMQTCESETGYNPTNPYYNNLLTVSEHDSTVIPWTGNCPRITWRALGSGEYTDARNYQVNVPGSKGIFSTTWCHRLFFAKIANLALHKYTTIPTDINVYPGKTQREYWLMLVFASINQYYEPDGTQNFTDHGAEEYGHKIYDMGSIGPTSQTSNNIGWDATDLDAPLTPSSNVPLNVDIQGNGNSFFGCPTT